MAYSTMPHDQMSATWGGSWGFVALCIGFVALCNDFVALCNGFVALCNGFVALCNGFVALCNGFVALCIGFVALCIGFMVLYIGFVVLVLWFCGFVVLWLRSAYGALSWAGEGIRMKIKMMIDAMGHEGASPQAVGADVHEAVVLTLASYLLRPKSTSGAM